MILDNIIEKKRMRVEERKKIITLEEVYEEGIRNLNTPNRFKESLEGKGLSIIGEFKKASPSKGVILEDFNIDRIHNLYRELGVDDYSILTEEDFFQGKDEYLKKIRSKSEVPILRKDFIFDFYQIYETKNLGASGILLIVSLLGDKLKNFYDECKKISLEPLVEVHDRRELEIALDSGCEIIGINNRNLKTFETTLDTIKELIKYIPKEKVIISESGINTIDDLRRVRDIGVNGALIGEMFMRNINNENFKREFTSFMGKKNDN